MVGSDRPSRFLATRLERSSAVPSEAQMCGAHPGRAGERIEALGILLNAATDEKGQPGFTYPRLYLPHEWQPDSRVNTGFGSGFR